MWMCFLGTHTPLSRISRICPDLSGFVRISRDPLLELFFRAVFPSHFSDDCGLSFGLQHVHRCPSNNKQIDAKILLFSVFVCIPHFALFCIVFYAFLQVSDPRSNRYLQHFREVRVFSTSSKKLPKLLPKLLQIDAQKASKLVKKTLSKRTLKMTSNNDAI